MCSHQFNDRLNLITPHALIVIRIKYENCRRHVRQVPYSAGAAFNSASLWSDEVSNIVLVISDLILMLFSNDMSVFCWNFFIIFFF